MPRAGSGWFYNLTHDLMAVSGFQDARQIRKRYHLERILTEVNCNIGALTPKRLILVFIPVLTGNRFVIKTHASLTLLATSLIQLGVIKPLYIYRDPRDALLSAFEYGERSRQHNRAGAFSQLTTIEEAVNFMREYVEISQVWLACQEALHTRYEDLLLDYDNEVNRIVKFLGLDRDSENIRGVVKKYCPKGVQSGQRGIHLVKGKIGRYKASLTPEQQSLCLQIFQPYLEERGYIL